MFASKTNQKRTVNESVEKLESMEFELSERDRELRDKFIGVTGGNLEINKLKKEYEILQNKYDELLEENIQLGEANERLKSLALTYSDSGQKIKGLENQIEQLQQAGNLAVKYYRTAEEKLKEVELEKYRLERELNEKRNFSGVVKDKAVIAALQSKVKDLEKRLLNFGRLPISKIEQELIINLYEQKCSYSKIADRVGVSRSTVSKYVVKYLAESNRT